MLLNPDKDLEVIRHLTAPPALVWRCWTDADLFRQWYAPKPFHLDEVVMDLCPGGRFFMVMVGPEGQRMPNEGAFLEVVPERRLVFTDLMTEGYAPVAAVSADHARSGAARIRLRNVAGPLCARRDSARRAGTSEPRDRALSR